MVPEKSSRHRVLIIDDEPLNRELLRRVLQREYEIIEAEDAAHGLVALEAPEANIELVLCDQLMPGRSGTDLAGEVHQRWPHVVFFLLTGYDDDNEVISANERGIIQGVVAKPWRAASLKQLIEQSFSASR
jgi:two-component system response regulator HupR/HoxA